MKFTVSEGEPGGLRVGELIVTQNYGVFVSFGEPGELNFEDEQKWLASFRNREDAEAYKSRKEKEYR